ncbi:MAG TPA: glycerol-3-phosphate 1-O-acyltransferase PlsY, partial [Pontiella sp.]|nr:glycerol-3-phosphate 1-O-acyltransferase PlsY [Pontiella sp.]
MDRVLLSAAAYLLGAVPFGLLVAKMHGVDIRSKGSGNIGATNVFRVIGKGWGIFTFVLDALKGFIPAFFFPVIGNVDPVYGVLFGFASIVGHTFPVYLKFKGGKGVATSAGMLLGVAPLAVGVGFLSWVICMVVSRYVSLSSIVAAVVVAATVWIQGDKALVVNIALTMLAI